MLQTNITVEAAGASKTNGIRKDTGGEWFCTGGAIQQASDGKVTAAVIAQLALAGHAVHHIEDGFLVTRWGITKVCPDLASLVGFARQIGVRHD
jgi:hypothetical protein